MTVSSFMKSGTIQYDVMPEIYGSDIDAHAITLAKENAIKAGVDDCIQFETKSCFDIKLPIPSYLNFEALKDDSFKASSVCQ